MIPKTIAFLLAAASGVQSAQVPAADKGERPDYSLSIRAKQAETRVGSQVTIEVVQTNMSDHQLTTSAGSGPDEAAVFYKTYVYGGDGALAPETKFGRRVRTEKDDPGETTVIVGEALLRYLQPGGSLRDEITLNRLYDLSKPGKYTVQVQGLDSAGRVAKSNTVTIIITSGPKGAAK
jgi:hypothetical protein